MFKIFLLNAKFIVWIQNENIDTCTSNYWKCKYQYWKCKYQYWKCKYQYSAADAVKGLGVVSGWYNFCFPCPCFFTGHCCLVRQVVAPSTSRWLLNGNQRQEWGKEKCWNRYRHHCHFHFCINMIKRCGISTIILDFFCPLLLLDLSSPVLYRREQRSTVLCEKWNLSIAVHIKSN